MPSLQFSHIAISCKDPLAIEPRTGVSIRFWQFVQYELALVPGLIFLSALAGFLPALAAYRADVGKVLSAAP